MENPNQNGLTATQDMLNQIKAEKKANQAVLKQIQDAQAALGKDRQVFETYKSEQTQLIEDARKGLKAESDNHAKLDTVQMTAEIDDLKGQVSSLTSENEALKKEVEALKAQAQAQA